ncbi:MAG TPA: carbohydrate-binding protein [Luteolibacter sp.]
MSALLMSGESMAREFHVSAVNGNDATVGSSAKPFKTIMAAANKAMPGDTITVHAGIYRERIDPPRGGLSDTQRIIYQAAKGEKVIITGSELTKGWQKVSGDAWKLVVPNEAFGNFNPYVDTIRGDFFISNGRVHHTGCVYLNGAWMLEATSLDQVLMPGAKLKTAAPTVGAEAAGLGSVAAEPVGDGLLWFATVDGDNPTYLMNLGKVKPSAGPAVSGGEPSYRYGGQPAPNSEGGVCSGWIQNGQWLRFDNMDFGDKSESIELRASAQDPAGARVELRINDPEGELLGVCDIPTTQTWTNWTTFTAKIKPVSGKKSLCVVFKSPKLDGGKTTIYAQFPGIDPNSAKVEINKRQTVFYPSRNSINYITVRGFTLLNGATQWAPPSSEQIGMVGTNWSKGWIIENNEIAYSKCAGIALGKYGDGTDNTNGANAADPYTACVRRALEHGWNKETVGSHIVRNNHIHHCEQVGVVGSLGCSFSTVTGNDIHDIFTHHLYNGYEQAGIKFHGFIDGVVADNHIYRCGALGVWLDWMCQGAQVKGNLLHDNSGPDVFLEMQHGPMLISNNVLLSGCSLNLNAKDLAIAHNFLNGSLYAHVYDDRKTPYHPPHSTAFAGLCDAVSGNHRIYNNLFENHAKPGWGATINSWRVPSVTEGNVYVRGAVQPTSEAAPLVNKDWDTKAKIVQKSDGWYLTLAEDQGWKNAVKRKLVTTELLGLAKVPNLPYENADGTPLAVDTDYFGKTRDKGNPFPGPFETPLNGEIKVWPKN